MAPEITHYDWSGGREAMLRWGGSDGSGPIVIVALPLFEEANRTRAFAVALCRALADRGIAALLPDLPGQGESLAPLEGCSLLTIAEGVACATRASWNEGRRLFAISIRSGALLDKLGLFDGRWRLAPQSGPELLRELKRIKQAASARGDVLDDLWHFDPTLAADRPDPPVEVAGNLISTALLTDLTVYEPWGESDGFAVRTVRLASDPKPADLHVPGAPLWRSAEPGNDPALAALLADDIAAWIAACAA